MGDFLGGTHEDPGAFGTGQYVAPKYNIDRAAFDNPLGNKYIEDQYKSGMGNFYGVSQPINAPTANAAQLGASKSYYGAAISPYVMSQGANINPAAQAYAAQLNGQQYNSTYNQEQGLANQLSAQARGLGPSVAQAQAQQQAGQNLNSQLAFLGSQRGASNPAVAQYQAQQAGAIANQQAAQQAVLG